MENNQNKKSEKFQGGMFNFCDFIQVFVFTKNHHLNGQISIIYHRLTCMALVHVQKMIFGLQYLYYDETS